MNNVNNLIGGQSVPGSTDTILEVENPATGEVIASFHASDASDVDRAVAAAREAQKEWAALTPGQRSLALHRAVDAVEARMDELVDLEVADAGKPITAAREEEFPAIIDALRHFAGAGRALTSQPAGEYSDGTTTLVRREPLGVVAGITPWNYPLWQAAWKIVPALAVGNAVVVKPAELTPLSTTLFAEIIQEHLPAGVVNVVNGLGGVVGKTLSEHTGVDLVSFTGSSATGRAIAAAAASGPRRAILELGGNAPVIVHDDADLDTAVPALAGAGLYNAGQECMAATRIIVHRSIAEDFVARLVEEFRNVVVGDPLDESTTLGPLISAKQLERVEELIAGARPTADIVVGGRRIDGPGHFFAPTIITGLEQSDPLIQEEIFGPVVTVQVFDDEDEALAWANDVEQGLAASVWTKDVARGLRTVNGLNFGNAWINRHLIVGPDYPIGGFKASGYGKEGGLDGIAEFTRTKQIGIALGD